MEDWRSPLCTLQGSLSGATASPHFVACPLWQLWLVVADRTGINGGSLATSDLPPLCCQLSACALS
eukprot:scaffold16567_cov42-Phaeocystis_antarctica.AAC.1